MRNSAKYIKLFRKLQISSPPGSWYGCGCMNLDSHFMLKTLLIKLYNSWFSDKTLNLVFLASKGIQKSYFPFIWPTIKPCRKVAVGKRCIKIISDMWTFCGYFFANTDMAGFMKKVSKIVQNFFARLPAIARQSSLCGALEPRGLAVKQGCGKGARVLATSCYQAGLEGPVPREWGGSQRETFSLPDSLSRVFCAGLGSGSQPATHRQGGSACCAVTGCLWLTDWKSLCISWKSCSLVVLKLTRFS